MIDIRLIDGPLIADRETRAAKVERMAKDLIRFGSVNDERDAIRSLVFSGRYGAADVVMLVDDARQVAMCEIVAREMGES